MFVQDLKIGSVLYFGAHMFTAVCLSNGKLDQSGFETEELAMSYISGLICNKCNSDFKVGYYFIEDNSDEKAIVNNVLETDCGAEWLVVTDKEYESSETLEDLFISFGLTPVDQEEEDIDKGDEAK